MEITITAPATVPAGTYAASLVGIEERTSREGVEFLRWGFTVRDGTTFVEVSGASSTNTGPKAKAYRWFSGLLGHKPQPDERIETDALVGKACLVVLELNEAGYATVTDVLPGARLAEATVAAYADQADAANDPF